MNPLFSSLRSSLSSLSRSRTKHVVAGVLGLAALGTLTFEVACSTAAPGTTDASAVLGELSTTVVLPACQDLDTKAEALRAAVNALEASPDETTIVAAEDAWRAARYAWRRFDALAFGPVESKRIAPALDFGPANPDAIERAVSEGASEATAFDALGSNAKGFLALEYLLFDDGGAHAEALAKLSTGDAAAARRAYVSKVASSLRDHAHEVFTSWDPSGENYDAELRNAGASSAIYPSTKAAIDELVNQVNVTADRLQNTEIGHPFGKLTGGTPAPESEETRRSDNSINDMRATLEGIRHVYLGDGGKRGLSTLVKARSESADAHMQTALDDASRAIEAMPPPFRTAVTASSDAVEAAYTATQQLKTTISTEVASVLGTTLKFSDNDGD